MKSTLFLATALALMLAGAETSRAQSLVAVPYVGAVTDSSAVVAVWCAPGATLRLQWSIDPLFTAFESVQLAGAAGRDSMVKIALGGLAAATRYHYRVVDGGGGVASAPRSFETFPSAGIDAPVSFFFGSCHQSRPEDVGKVFDVAADLGGDLFVQMGDWAYPDVRIVGYPSSDSAVRASYVLRLDTAYPFPRRVLAEMPIAYVWDDHDSFGDNSDGASSTAVKARVHGAYERYVPHYPLANPSAGIWQSVRMGNVELFLIDSRSQRSPIDSALRGTTFVPPPGHSMLAGFPVAGIDQRRWLLDALRRSTARWKIIVSPVPFNPAMAPGIALALFGGRRDIAREFAEYWIGYPADIDSLRALLRSSVGRNTLIVSGSAHTNMYDDGRNSIVPEFVAANLDIPNSNLRDTLRQYGLNVWTAGQTGSNNTVGRVRVETTPAHRLIVESFDEDGALELQYVMVDSTAGTGVADMVDASSRGAHATITDHTLRIEFDHAPRGSVDVELYDVGGRLVLQAERESVPLAIELPASLAAGSYLGRVRIDGVWCGFRVVAAEGGRR